jgi:hypothetical protein
LQSSPASSFNLGAAFSFANLSILFLLLLGLSEKIRHSPTDDGVFFHAEEGEKGCVRDLESACLKLLAEVVAAFCRPASDVAGGRAVTPAETGATSRAQ